MMNQHSQESRQRPVKKVWMNREEWQRNQEIKQILATAQANGFRFQ
jgi:hypothetical protein